MSMQTVQSHCIPVNDYPAQLYQSQARARFSAYAEKALEPWSWISTTCQQQCLHQDHLIAHNPVRINYPAGVCIYCGFPSGTKDHLVPRNWSGNARRVFVAVVPACVTCNNLINDLPDPCVTARRKVAHAGIKRRNRSILAAPDWSDADLAELGHNLRSRIIQLQAKKRVLREQLKWPEDPFYDLRAFEKSGVDDPYALGLVGALQRQWVQPDNASEGQR